MTDDLKNSLLEAALEIAAAGVPVFPCAADKTPLCPGGFKAASTDPHRVRSLFSHTATRMIGMPTGRASGFNVIDIDPRHGGDAWLDENRAQLPLTRTVKTLSGGLHLYFRLSETELRNSAGKTKSGKGIAPGVDVRGEGGYVVVQPSPGYSIADARPPAAMPAWLVDLCRKPADNPAPPPPRPATARPQGDASPFGRAALDSACGNLRNAPEGSKHDVLNREAYSIGGLVAGGELPEGEAFAALLDALHDLAARGTIKDFKAAEQTLRRAFKEGKSKARIVPELPGRVPADEGGVDFSALIAKAMDSDGAIRRAAAAKPLPVDDFLYDCPGAMQLWLEYCAATSISPQPFLALAAGISAIGVLAGRRYRTETNLRTNIYAVGIADSGGGKDHAPGCVKEVFAAADLFKYLGGEDIASGAAMITALTRHPCMLFQLDEFGDWLGDVLGPKSAPHKKNIALRLKTLYSSAGRIMPGTEYADQSKIGKPREDIVDPHACLYGTTTPQQFWKAIQSGSLEDGLLARFLIFVSPESYPDRKKPARIDPPADLVAAFKAISEGVADPNTGELGRLMLANTKPEPYTVPMTADAEAAYEDMEQHQLARQRAAAGTYVTSIAGRLTQNATKLALLRAISRAPGRPVIGADDIAWGRAIAEHCIDTLLREADDNVGDSDFEKKVAKVKKIIKQHGPVTERDIWQRGFKSPARELREVLDNLERGGDIVATECPPGPKGGRPTVRYSIALSG